MEFSIKLVTFKSGWSIVSVEGYRLYFPTPSPPKKIVSPKFYRVSENSAEHDEMPFHICLHCLT